MGKGLHLQQNQYLLLYWHYSGRDANHSEKWRGNILVRRSYERALDESLFLDIEPMNSFRDASKELSVLQDTVYLETEVIPLALFQRFQKYFPFKNVKSVDTQIAAVRAVKSKYELSLMRKAGRIHQHMLEDILPEMLHEGMSEVDLSTELFSVMVENGHDGL
jgi:Xaa-Pro aminopeptidase